MILLPKQFVDEVISLLHLLVCLHRGVDINLEHRCYCLAIGGWPFYETQAVRIACLHKVHVVLAEDVAYHVVLWLPIIYSVGR